jgi:hypothetical protein
MLTGGIMSLFINLTHHPFNKWSKDQIDVAKIHPLTSKKLEIVDLQFPSVKSSFDKVDIMKIANRYTNIVLEIVKEKTGKSYEMDFSTVIQVMGEMSLTYSLVKLLKEYKFYVVVSCTERTIISNGINKKIKFEFVRFREY